MDEWLKAEGLNRSSGDPKDTMYTGGNPFI